MYTVEYSPRCLCTFVAFFEVEQLFPWDVVVMADSLAYLLTIETALKTLMLQVIGAGGLLEIEYDNSRALDRSWWRNAELRHAKRGEGVISREELMAHARGLEQIDVINMRILKETDI